MCKTKFFYIDVIFVTTLNAREEYVHGRYK